MTCRGVPSLLARYRASRWLFRWGVILAVVLGSFVPGGDVPSVVWDVGHMPAYLVLTSALLFSRRGGKRRPEAILRVVLAISAMGLVIELLQPLAGRTTSVIDFGMNEAGVSLGVMCYVLYCLVADRPDGLNGSVSSVKAASSDRGAT